MGNTLRTVFVQFNAKTIKMPFQEKVKETYLDTESLLVAIKSYIKEREKNGLGYITFNPNIQFYKERIAGVLQYSTVNASDIMPTAKLVDIDTDQNMATVSIDTKYILDQIDAASTIGYVPRLIPRILGKIVRNTVTVDEELGTTEQRMELVMTAFISLDLVLGPATDTDKLDYIGRIPTPDNGPEELPEEE